MSYLALVNRQLPSIELLPPSVSITSLTQLCLPVNFALSQLYLPVMILPPSPLALYDSAL